MLAEATTIDVSDFERVDMRVGRILEAEPFRKLANRPTSFASTSGRSASDVLVPS